MQVVDHQRGWAALAAGSAILYLVTNATLGPSTGQGAGYTCWRNAYDCSHFRTRAEAQAAYLACGGLQNDVHHLDRDRDSWACERLP